MFSRWIRTWDAYFFKPFLVTIAVWGVTPNMLTLASLVSFVVCGIAVFLGYTGWALVFLVWGGLLDAMDGELARHILRETNFGAFLDAIVDHLGDFAVYLGLLCLSLRRQQEVSAVLVLVAMFGSLYGSFIRSRAGMLGIDIKKVGWCTRFERVVILAIGLGTEAIEAALWVLAVATNLSACQRLVRVVTATAQPQKEG